MSCLNIGTNAAANDGLFAVFDDFVSSAIDVAAGTTDASRSLDVLDNDTLTNGVITRTKGEIEIDITNDILGTLTVGDISGENRIIIPAGSQIGVYNTSGQTTYRIRDDFGSCSYTSEVDIYYQIINTDFSALSSLDFPSVSIDSSTMGGNFSFLTNPSINLQGRSSNDVIISLVSTSDGISVNSNNEIVIPIGITLGTYNITYNVADINTQFPHSSVSGGPFSITINVQDYIAMSLVDDTLGNLGRTLLVNPYNFISNDDLGGRSSTDPLEVSISLTVNPDPVNITLTGTNNSMLNINSNISLGNYSVTYQIVDNTVFAQPNQTANITFSIIEQSDANGNFDDNNPIGINASYSILDNSLSGERIFLRSPVLTSTQVADVLLQNYTGTKETQIRTVLEDVLSYFIQKGEEAFFGTKGLSLMTTRTSTGVTVTFRL